MLTSHAVSENGDIVVAMDAQWAFHVFGDPQSYEGFIGDWTARSIADVALRHMNEEKLLAWGTPQGRFSFRLHQGKKLQKTFH
ncbi:hypothetical protein [Roseimicrobium sp. ORNL1]|uniref:hypothetical protein n=1 Tax=Roseimicrobium sp. ORNL1 TaxID=2711231 RepID=UPI0013E1DDCF|nr:hypothetical protein [Roseimicrobium sp. ORNL1]QIF02746.1 hypothetical protein G5S37_14855 [Roseimicrobium sp. ORNL1]